MRRERWGEGWHFIHPSIYLPIHLSIYLFVHLFMYLCILPFPMAQQVKNLLSRWKTQETWVWSLGQEDSLEKQMATHSSTLAWRIPWTEKPDGLWSMGSQRVRHDWVTNTFTFIHPSIHPCVHPHIIHPSRTATRLFMVLKCQLRALNLKLFSFFWWQLSKRGS